MQTNLHFAEGVGELLDDVGRLFLPDAGRVACVDVLQPRFGRPARAE